MTAPQSPAVADASLPAGVSAALLGRQDAAGDVQPCGSAEPVTGAAEPTPSGFGASPAALTDDGATWLKDARLLILSPGDLLVIETPHVPTLQSAELVRAMFRERGGITNEVVVLGDGARLGVIRPSDRSRPTNGGDAPCPQ